MPKYFATAFFTQKSAGWTETYYRDAGDVTDLAALADFDRKEIWTARAKALGKEATIVAQRVSFDNVNGDSVINYIPIVGNTAWSCDTPDTSLLVRLGNTPNARRKNVFMRGIPQKLIINGGDVDGDFAAWKGAADSFFAQLVTLQYGWRGVVVPSTEVNVTTWTSDPTNHIVFTIGAGLPVFQNGDKIVLRGKNMGVGLPSVLNTSLPCIYVNATTVKTAKAIAAFAYPGDGPKLVYKTYDLFRAANWRYQKIDSRKAGKASHVQAGRSRVRAKG